MNCTFPETKRIETEALLPSEIPIHQHGVVEDVSLSSGVQERTVTSSKDDFAIVELNTRRESDHVSLKRRPDTTILSFSVTIYHSRTHMRVNK